jgi:hypothetical protein
LKSTVTERRSRYSQASEKEEDDKYESDDSKSTTTNNGREEEDFLHDANSSKHANFNEDNSSGVPCTSASANTEDDDVSIVIPSSTPVSSALGLLSRFLGSKTK